MNVLLACPWPLDYRGGVAVIVRMLALGLRRSGHRVCVLIPTYGEKVNRRSEDDLTVFEVPMRLPFIREHPVKSVVAFLIFLPITCMRLARLMRQEQIDLINIHYFSPQWIYLLLLRVFLRFRLVISVHGTDIHGLDGPRNLARLERWHAILDAIVFCSEASRRSLANESRLLRNSFVILNAIDPDSLPSPLAEGERTHSVVCNGHLQKHKGQDILVRAFARVADEFKDGVLEIVGDGSTRLELKTLITELRLEDKVRLRGGLPRDEAMEIVRASMAICVPSRRETFGLVLLEAMALEVPIIASRTGGIPEVVRDGVDGILVEPENLEELAFAIRRILTDTELRRSLVASGKERVRQIFSIENFLLSYRDLYSHVLLSSKVNVPRN